MPNDIPLPEQYQNAVKQGELMFNEQQFAIIHQLEILRNKLEKQYQHRSHCLKKYGTYARQAIEGIYIWGGVGIGKSVMIEMLYASLTGGKKRQHFHAFMNGIHQALHCEMGNKNPLQRVIRKLAMNIQVLFLDEFVVNDISDAMILSGILYELTEAGICLLTTSNIQPKDLYRFGFQREKFLPTITHIYKHCNIIDFAQAQDYRKQNIGISERYLTPITSETDHHLQKKYDMLKESQPSSGGSIEICGRKIDTIEHSGKIVWLDFKVICSSPRSTPDYIELADMFHMVIISNIPNLAECKEDVQLRFIRLIDVLYDENIQLLVSSDIGIAEHQIAGKNKERFERTRSRLFAMTK